MPGEGAGDSVQPLCRNSVQGAGDLWSATQPELRKGSWRSLVSYSAVTKSKAPAISVLLLSQNSGQGAGGLCSAT